MSKILTFIFNESDNSGEHVGVGVLYDPRSPNYWQSELFLNAYGNRVVLSTGVLTPTLLRQLADKMEQMK